jgi:uncharacterized protein (TIGR02246 family)
MHGPVLILAGIRIARSAIIMESKFLFHGRFRRTVVVSLVSALIFTFASSESVGSGATQRKNPDNQKLITASIENLVSAWNAKNSDSIARVFLTDAVLVLPTGSVTKSRANIRRRLMAEWQGKLKDSKLTHFVEAVSFEGGEAIVKGRYKLDGVTLLGFTTEGPFVLRQKQQQGRWMIARAEILRNAD